MTQPKYFTLEELLTSSTARQKSIENLPSFEIVETLCRLGITVLDRLRDELGKPITVKSGYRNAKLNAAVNGAKGSQHLLGEAADIVCYDNRKLFDIAKRLIEEEQITVGQLIWEKGTKKAPAWVHISLPNAKHKNEVKYLY